MAKFPTVFEATLYIDDSSDHHCKPYRVCGLLYSESFADAARQIEECYGDELSDMKIELYEDGIIEFHPKDLPVVRKLLNNYINGSTYEEVKPNEDKEMWGMRASED